MGIWEFICVFGCFISWLVTHDNQSTTTKMWIYWFWIWVLGYVLVFFFIFGCLK